MQQDISPILPPASVYLARHAPVTRQCARGRLDTLASLMLPGSDSTTFPWPELPYRETAQVRAALESRFHYRTANNHLYVLRGILRECFNLGLMTSDAYHRAIAFQPIKGHSLPAGRYVEPELDARSEAANAEMAQLEALRMRSTTNYMCGDCRSLVPSGVTHCTNGRTWMRDGVWFLAEQKPTRGRKS